MTAMNALNAKATAHSKRYNAGKPAMSRILAWFYLRIVKPTKLPYIASGDKFQWRLGLCRFLVGLIALIRTALIALASYNYFEPSTIFGLSLNIQFLASMAVLFLVFCLMIGFFTPLACLLLLLAYPQADRLYASTTLGTMVFTLLLALLLSGNAGRHFSVDSFLQGGKSRLGMSIARLYRLFPQPNSRQLRLYQWFAFASYAITSFGALTFHVQDHAWLCGSTLQIAMASPFWCSQYRMVRDLHGIIPALVDAFLAAGILGQSVFQSLMLMLVYWRAGYRFVAFWSFTFFWVSWTMLQLSYLAPLELVLWILLFLPWSRLENQAYRAAVSAGSSSGPKRYQSYAIARTILPVFCLLSLTYVFEFSFIENDHPDLRLPPAVQKLLYCFAYWCPNVFNADDLQASNYWPVLFRNYGNGRQELAPFNGEDGSRRLYYILDPIYFGNCLSWRRGAAMPGADVVEFSRPGHCGYQMVDELIRFDYKLAAEKPISYDIKVMASVPGTLQGKTILKYSRKISAKGEPVDD